MKTSDVGCESHEYASESLPHDKCSKVNESSYKEIPEVGMEFATEESAYDFYNKYARLVGFSIRKSDASKSNGITRRRKFCCSKEGTKAVDKRVVKNPQPDTRTGCGAHMIISYQSNGAYHIIKFEPSHNHDNVPSPLRHNLRSQRKIKEVQAAQVDVIESSGLAPKTVVDLMSQQMGGRKNLGFTLNDVKNYLRTKRERRMENGIAGALIEYFKKKQKQNPSFFHSMQLDADEQITNVFWADARMIVDYAHFGDVLCFDTTYRTNNHGRPFAPFVGVNNHRQTIIFGGALLYDETADSFIWLFKTFLEAMSRKSPKTILTDQSAAMAKAISIAMPETRHRLCIWHLTQNATKHLGHLYSVDGLKKSFYQCIFGYETEKEFVDAWKNMLDIYNLHANKWLQQTYAEKKKWALVYGRETFCADMKSTQRSESFNALLRRYLNSKHDPLRFFQHFERVVDDRREAELCADFKMMNTLPRIPYETLMVSCAARVYTAEVLELFQIEYAKSLNCSIYIQAEVEYITEYKVMHAFHGHERTVIFDSSNDMATCSCKNYEFVGIQCCHVLKVLDHRNIKELPQKYILKRWTKHAKSGVVYDSHAFTVQDDLMSQFGRRFQELCYGLLQVASKAAETSHSAELLKCRTEEIMQEIEEDVRKQSVKYASTAFEDDRMPIELVVPAVAIESTSKNEIVKGFKRRGKKSVGGKCEKRMIGVLEKIPLKKSRSYRSQNQPEIIHESANSNEHQWLPPMVGNNQDLFNYNGSQGITSTTQMHQEQETFIDPTDQFNQTLNTN